MYSICSVQTYVPSTKYCYLVVEALGDLVQETFRTGYDYYNRRTDSEQTVYGHRACYWKFSQPACNDCTHRAHQTVVHQCPNAIGAQVLPAACRIRYEDYAFAE